MHSANFLKWVVEESIAECLVPYQGIFDLGGTVLDLEELAIDMDDKAYDMVVQGSSAGFDL